MKGSVQDVFIPNDSVIFDNTGIAQHSVVLKDVLPVSGWNVSSSGNYTFTGAGNIAGTGGLLKSGTGKLSIFTSNSFTGKVNLNGGITEVNSINDKGVPGSFGASDAISINGGTLMLSQKTISTNRNMQIGAKGAVLTVADSRFQCLLEGIISGEGTIVKNGPGNLLLASGNNFSGGITINEGNVILAGKTGNVGGPGSGLITLNGGSLIMSDVQQSETVPWAMNVPEGKTAGFQPDGRCFLTGSLTGGGTLNMLIPYIRTEFKGNWSAFSGTINLTYNPAYDSHFRINNTFGYPLATFNLTQNAKMYRLITGSVTVGSVTSASATAELATTDGSGRTTNWIVGSNNKDATFAGLISGPGTITKTGSGMWVLTNANTVSGDIIIQGGKLIANNLTGSATGAGKIFVNNSGTLAGSGIIDGVVQVAQGGNITSGLTTPGTFTLNNDLILQAGAKTTIKITSLKNDKIIVGGKIVVDGILEMMKLGIVLKAGDSFTIFQAPAISGQFDSIMPAYPGTGLKWNLSRISEGIVGVDTEDALPGLSENIIKVYPTRVDSFCNLEFNGLTGKILVEILDAGGEMMMSELITINENIHSLKMNHLSAGVYVMNFKYKNEIFQKRIVKL
jgi:autotransporter-associated beta strand protein